MRATPSPSSSTSPPSPLFHSGSSAPWHSNCLFLICSLFASSSLSLQTLLLHGNRLTTLARADRLLPASLVALTLNANLVSDLAEVSHLSGLPALEELTLAGNPALRQPEETSKQFDYRPYVVNWCTGLRLLDGAVVGAKER